MVQHDNRNRREAAILPFVYLPAGSPERLAALEAQAKATGFSVRSLNRWAALYVAYGVNGLANRKPANAGQRRVLVSRTFDTAFRATGYQDELLAAIAAEVVQVTKGVWKSRREASGYNAVIRDVQTHMELICERSAVNLPASAFKISRRRVEELAYFREVNKFRNNRKKWDDEKPRIRRDWTVLKPMDAVVADVKPFDVIVTRPDGSTHYARLIGFHDAATFRLFVHVVLCKPGEGIRQEHVHDGLIAMVMHPEWGFPRSLYLDNGSEFGGLEKLRDAMALLSEPGARTIVHAKPYNASAKPVESNFARLDKLFTCVMQGYAGKDRMAKKTQTVGKPPQPYPHGFHQFVEEIQLGIADLNHTALTTPLWRGRSPQQVWQEAVDAGWRPVTVAPLVLDAAFHVRDTRRVGKGHSLRIDGKSYVVPGLRVGSEVSVALPWRRGAAPLYLAQTGDGWTALEEDHPFPATWTDGAPASARRNRAAVKAIRAMERDAPEIDPIETIRERARRRVGAQVRKGGPALDVDDELAGIAFGLKGRSEPAAAVSEEERIRRQRDATTRRLQRAERYG